MFGYKNHIGIDRAHGLIRSWDASAANAHDGARLPELVSKQNTGSGLWADTAYRSKRNEAFLERGMFRSNIHQRRMPLDRCPSTSPGPKLSAPPCARRSSTCSRARSTAWVCSSAPSASLVPGSRSAWRTSPITSTAFPGFEGEVCPRSAKKGCRGARRPRKRRKPGRKGQPSRTQSPDQTSRAAVTPKIARSSRCPAHLFSSSRSVGNKSNEVAVVRVTERRRPRLDQEAAIILRHSSAHLRHAAAQAWQ